MPACPGFSPAVPSRPRWRFAVALLVLLLPVRPSRAADGPAPQAKLTRAAAAAVAGERPAARQPDGTVAVWVWFRDRGLAPAALAAALDARERSLDARERRRRARAGRERLVDVSDLPVSARYVNAVAAAGVHLRRRSRWLNAVSCDATPDQVRALAALPFVRRVSLVGKARTAPPPPEPAAAAAVARRNRELRAEKAGAWSIDYGNALAQLEQIAVPPVHEEGYTGQGIRIGMLDSGFHTGHEALAPIPVIATWDFVNDDGNVDNEPGDPANAKDHGTMTLSTIMANKPGFLVGPAFGAEVVLAKTEDVSTEEPFEEDNWVAGIEWLDSYGVDVVSSSLGYLDWYVFDDMDGNTAACTIAADRAVGRGIVVVNSAGNERGSAWGHIIAPADGDSVIAAGAVTISGTVSSFSSPGPTADGRIKPDVAALGSGDAVVDPNDDRGYTTASGTSFSCPLTAGVAALVLCRAPGLSPIQVREALRQTASRADSPDNDYGWGIVNALAAVHYWGPTITHQPLGDTEDTTGPYPVTCTITDRAALDPAGLRLWYRVDGGAWQEVPLQPAGGDTFRADIPGQPGGSDVAYYLEAADSLGLVITDPPAGAGAPHAFHVGPDVTPPVIVHTPLPDQPWETWPPEVSAQVTDNIGVADVHVAWSRNGTAQADFPLAPAGGDTYAAPFPLPQASVAVGDTIAYTVIARDAAAAPNTSQHGPHGLRIIQAQGRVLVIDDTGGAKAVLPPKPGPDKRPATATGTAADPTASPGTIARWLTAAGYVVETVRPENLDTAVFASRDFVVLSSGGNTDPVATAQTRDLVEQWVAGGGKLLVEGGETAYDALVTPGYSLFAQQVLHAATWRADSGGDLQQTVAAANHPLVTTPHPLPATLALAYGTYGDQDAVTPSADALLLYEAAAYGGAAGLLVYDDDPAPASGQIVVLAANLAALADSTAARHLVENAAAYFLADQGSPTASLAGTVSRLSGDVTEPLAGADVWLAGGDTVQTDAQGQYQFTGLYPGTYTVTATAAGLSRAVATVTLADGEAGTRDLVLYPVTTSVFAASPGAAIPDNDPAGIADTLQVPSLGPISSVAVDVSIQHPWIGDLTVELVAPSGTTVRLHDRSGSSNDDIVGRYPDSLAVDGPGSLDDLVGELPAGPWILRVTDHAGGDAGTLVSWGLAITWAADGVTGAPSLPAPVTRLLGAFPNPFNPRTSIRFRLARPAAPRLEVFDLRGRLVRRLLNARPLPAGVHAVTWDGRDDGGRPAGVGEYLLLLRVDGVIDSRKAILVK